MVARSNGARTGPRYNSWDGGAGFYKFRDPKRKGRSKGQGVLRGSEEGTRVPVVYSCIVTCRNYEVSMV